MNAPRLKELRPARPALLNGPVSRAGLRLELRPVLHHYPERMKFPRFATLRLKAENILPVHFFAYQLNRLLQSTLP